MSAKRVRKKELKINQFLEKKERKKESVQEEGRFPVNTGVYEAETL